MRSRVDLAIVKRTTVRVPVKLLRQVLVAALKSYGPDGASETSLAFISESAMLNLNKRYRGHNGATDVLSFSFLKGRRAVDSGPLLTGEVLINPGRAERQAALLGHSLSIELALLFLHGLLHVLKFDHEKSQSDTKKMARAEQKILSRIPALKWQKGVIMRASNDDKLSELVSP